MSQVSFVGRQFAIAIHQIVNLSPRPKPILQTRRGGTLFGGWGCVLYGAGVCPGMRASPSTCRVISIDWQVRGLCRCLCYARGLCLCPCVITGVPPSQHRRWSIDCRVLFQHTNKQTNCQKKIDSNEEKKFTSKAKQTWKKMKKSVNMSRVHYAYGKHPRLLTDTGIPPLQLTKYVHLAQLHFRLTITRQDTLPALLFKKT